MRRTPLVVLLSLGLLAASVVPAATASVAAFDVATGGSQPGSNAVLPDDRFTVADPAQATGRRIAFPADETCTAATSSRCDARDLINTLDGWDLQPRVFVPFTGQVDVTTLTPVTFYVEGGGARVGFQQLTRDPATGVLAATTRDQLKEQTRYKLVITRAVRDVSGRNLAREIRIPFTTMSGTTELDRIRRALDDGSAYTAAGITSRAPSFAQAGTTTVFPPTTTELINRNDQRSADPAAPLVSSRVPNLAVAGVGCYAFGSIETPRYSREDSTITPTPSGRAPAPVGKERIGFALIVPAGTPPAGGWPVAVYGPGFTRSYFDLFVTSDANAAAGIATLATDPVGHGYGPKSSISVGLPGAQTTFLSYGRGRDLDGDGAITADEGSQPTKRVTVVGGKITEEVPSPNALHGLRGGLIQTVVDNMALVRAVESGVTVPSCTGSQPSATLAKTGLKYYGLSFGGIYGTMLMGTDTHVGSGLLNVPGGPIIDIARLSAFRPRLGDTLRVLRPSLANGGPGRDGFTESNPLPYGEPITTPAKGALEVQRFLALAIWYGRPGGPETYAPLLRKAPRYKAKDVTYQVAFGDNTVPNVTGGNIIRAGALFDRITYYRNDKTPTSGSNPHGFLADPTLFGRQMGELQLTTFLKTGTVVDPDGPGPLFETPIANPDNLQCLHYPDPQTGTSAFPPAAAGECPPRPPDAAVEAFSGDSDKQGPASSSGTLPSTGVASGLAASALLLMGLGALLRRRRA